MYYLHIPPGLPIPNSPYGLCGRKATLEVEGEKRRVCIYALYRTKGVWFHHYSDRTTSDGTGWPGWDERPAPEGSGEGPKLLP